MFSDPDTIGGHSFDGALTRSLFQIILFIKIFRQVVLNVSGLRFGNVRSPRDSGG